MFFEKARRGEGGAFGSVFDLGDRLCSFFSQQAAPLVVSCRIFLILTLQTVVPSAVWRCALRICLFFHWAVAIEAREFFLLYIVCTSRTPHRPTVSWVYFAGARFLAWVTRTFRRCRGVRPGGFLEPPKVCPAARDRRPTAT